MPDAESFFYSRQKFQGILLRLEILVGEMERDPEPSKDTIKKNLEAILASSNDYAKFLRDLEKYAEKSSFESSEVKRLSKDWSQKLTHNRKSSEKNSAEFQRYWVILM